MPLITDPQHVLGLTGILGAKFLRGRADAGGERGCGMSRLFISSLLLPTQFRLRTPNRITGCERQSSGGKVKEGLVTHAGLKRIHDSRSNVSRTGVPAFFLVAAISVFSAAGSQAESGVLRVTVKDVTTHYALHADVMLEGPQKVSVRMNGAGRAILTLSPRRISHRGFRAFAQHLKNALQDCTGCESTLHHLARARESTERRASGNPQCE